MASVRSRTSVAFLSDVLITFTSGTNVGQAAAAGAVLGGAAGGPPGSTLGVGARRTPPDPSAPLHAASVSDPSSSRSVHRMPSWTAPGVPPKKALLSWPHYEIGRRFHSSRKRLVHQVWIRSLSAERCASGRREHRPDRALGYIGDPHLPEGSGAGERLARVLRRGEDDAVERRPAEHLSGLVVKRAADDARALVEVADAIDADEVLAEV